MKKVITVVMALAVAGIAIFWLQFRNPSFKPALPHPTALKSLSPQEIAQLFCKADYDGGRIGGSQSSNKYQNLSSHMVYPEGEFEPGWDMAIITSDFSFSAPFINNEIAKVVVTYTVLGSIAGAEELEINKKNENAEFQFRRVGAAWKLITPVDLPPHISKGTAIRSLEDLIDAHDKERSEHLQQLVSKIRAM